MLAQWKQPVAGSGSRVPLTHWGGCLDESAYLGWGAQFPFLEKGGSSCCVVFCSVLHCLHQTPPKSPEQMSPPPLTLTPRARLGRLTRPLCCWSSLPPTRCWFLAQLTHNRAVLRHGDSTKETSVCQTLNQQGSSNQGVIPILQEYKLSPREGKWKAPVPSSFGT